MNRQLVFTRGQPEAVSETLCQICIFKVQKAQQVQNLKLAKSAVPPTVRYSIVIIRIRLHMCMLTVKKSRVDCSEQNKRNFRAP
jgi:hypothetical protein